MSYKNSATQASWHRLYEHYYSELSQGICDDRGKFIDVFEGPPDRVHDSRMLMSLIFFGNWQRKMGNYHLLGDSAYISNDDSAFIRRKSARTVETISAYSRTISRSDGQGRKT